MNSHVILLDGDIVVTERLKALCAGRPVIAADGGIRHAEPLDLAPQVWLGDFDSAPDGPAGSAGIPIIPYPPEKDVTDGEIAIEYARERGANHLIFQADRSYSLLAANTGLRILACIPANPGDRPPRDLRPGTGPAPKWQHRHRDPR